MSCVCRGLAFSRFILGMRTNFCWHLPVSDADVLSLGAEECRCRRTPAWHGRTRMQARKYSCCDLLIPSGPDVISSDVLRVRAVNFLNLERTE